MNLLLIFGGRSCEHAVSVISAQSVMEVLAESDYQLSLVGITEQGQWRFSSDNTIESLLSNGKVDPDKGTPTVLCADGLISPERGQIQAKVEIIFPLLHGPFGEDGTIQGLFEMVGLPYVGCGVRASANGMDKLVSKVLFADAGIAQASYVGFNSARWQNEQDQLITDIKEKLAFPLFIKPANMGSSVGVSKVEKQQDLIEKIEHAFLFDNKVLVENGFENLLEVECAVLGNQNSTASVVGEIKAGAEFYDYDAKYIDDTSSVIIPAKLPDKMSEEIRQAALKAFKAIDGSGLARVDFFADLKNNQVWLNEINTLPGFTPISMYPKLWQASGLPYAQLIDKLIALAFEQYEAKKALKSSY